MGTNFYWIPEAIYEDPQIKKMMTHQADLDWLFWQVKPRLRMPYGFEPFKDYDINGVGDPLDDDFLHIGKRSGAGDFCTKCHTSLSKSGKDLIHYGMADQGWHEVCPVCGSSEKVYGCTFTWYDYDRDRRLLEYFKDKDLPVIRDEYGEVFTIDEFWKELDNSFVWKFSKVQFA